MPRRVHILYSGNVQGVYFRATSEKIAKTLPVTGWVKNLDDGRVELVAEGEHAALDTLLAEIARAKGRNIERADTTWSDATGEFTDFVIRR